MISMSRCPWVPKPRRGAMTSSLMTRSARNPIQRGSWWWPKEKVCHESSQSISVWKRCPAGRRVIISVCSRSLVVVDPRRLPERADGAGERQGRPLAGGVALEVGGPRQEPVEASHQRREDVGGERVQGHGEPG